MLILDMFDVLAVIGAAAVGIFCAVFIVWLIVNFRVERRDDFHLKEKQPEDLF